MVDVVQTHEAPPPESQEHVQERIEKAENANRHTVSLKESSIPIDRNHSKLKKEGMSLKYKNSKRLKTKQETSSRIKD